MRRAAATVCVGAVLLVGTPAAAQVRTVEILNADSVAVEEGAGGTVRRLVGSVRLREDTTYIDAPRATQYVERGEVVLEGPVRVRTGGVTLTADHVTYTSGSRIAAASGSVRIADGVSVLTAPSAHYAVREELAAFDAGGVLTHEGSVLTAARGTYDTRARLASFEGAVRLVDSSATLTAHAGTYDARARLASFLGSVRLDDSTTVLTAARGRYATRSRRAEFGGDVQLDRPAAPGRPALRVEADSLVHFRREERTLAWGQVVMQREDDESWSAVFGGSATHDGVADSSAVRGSESDDPLAVLVRTDSAGARDTTFARAPRLSVMRLDTLGRQATRVLAAGGARMASERFAAIADSAAMLRIDSTAAAPAQSRLLLAGGRPVAWADEAQIDADTLIATGRGSEPDTLHAFGSPFAAQMDTTLGRVRQLRGRRMLAVFADEGGERRLRRLSVWPNAEAAYFRAAGDGSLAGAEVVSADSLAFTFRAGELREVRGARGIEGTSYSARIVPADLQLPGYAYAPERRPTREALLPAQSWQRDWFRMRVIGDE